MPAEAMPLHVKICGLSTPETLEAALAAGADAIGLMRFPRSPRHLALDQAAALAARARGRAEVVLVLVDPGDREIDEAAETVRPDLLQLHGAETPDRVAAIRARIGLPVMKALGVAGTGDVARARSYAGAADRLLLDAKAPPSAKLPGGNGLRFDWRLVAGLDPPLRFMLSGGLAPDSVAEAVRLVRPAGVDVSSGVESRPGVKDPARIAAFLRAARDADRGA